MVRQHRRPAGDVLLEIPAGKLEPGEMPQECAQRELLEETGFQSHKWDALLSFYPSPGFCDEIIHLFLAEELTAAHSPTSDPEEKITIQPIPLEEAYKMIETGAIIDGKTIIALQCVMLREY
jgi:ADP-ribose pyrophosphatase